MSIFQGVRSAIVLAIASAPAFAGPPPAPSLLPTPGSVEAGLFAGTFISNFYHQFYDSSKWTAETRPNLATVSPLLGARYAYWPDRLLGFEGEASVAFAGIDGYAGTAALYGLRVQALVQYPARLAPFVALGAGLIHTSSSTLGTDTDWPVHLGAGARFFVTRALAIRFDARLLRGPSSQSPYTLNASYGELAVGVSWVPGQGTGSQPVLHIGSE